MLGTIISAVLGGGGGFLGSSLVSSLGGLTAGAGSTDSIIGIVSGLVGGSAVGGLLGKGGDAAQAGAAAAGGSINPKQIIGGLLGGAGAGGIGQAILGAIM